MRLRALIADDEPIARRLLRSMLDAHSEIDVIVECADGQSAFTTIRDQRPDVAFLDIRMPHLDGLEVAASFEPEMRPQIVFVTAFDEFAVRAFELHAVDYLLKPFDEQRLAQTIRRLVKRTESTRSTDSNRRFESFLGRLDRMGQTIERVAVKTGSDVVVVPLREVLWIESEANYVRLHTRDRSYSMRATLSGLEARLNPQRFVRIHRGTLVHLEYVQRLEPGGRGDFRVILRDETVLKLSRRYRTKLVEMLGGSV